MQKLAWAVRCFFDKIEFDLALTKKEELKTGKRNRIY